MKTLMNLVVVASLSAGVVGCKSPDNTTTDSTTDTTDPVETTEEQRLVSESTAGFWVGTMTSNTSGKVASISGLVTENNRIKLIESGVGTQFSGTVVSSGGSASADMVQFNTITEGAKKEIDISFNMESITEKVSVTGSYNSAEDSGKFILNYNIAYERPSTLTKIVGEWSNREESLKIDSSNGFNGQGANGCSYAGSVGIINPSFNAYNLNVGVTGCTDESLSGSYFGVAWLDDSINQDDTLKYSIVKSDGSASLSNQLTRTVVGETPSVAGIWRGTITSSTGKVTSIATGIIAENGAMQLTTSDGDVISGNIGVDTGTDVSAVAKFYKVDRSVQFDMTFAGTITEKNLLQGTYTKSDAIDSGGNFSLTYDVAYEQPSQQKLVSGGWAEQFESLLLNSIGTLAGTNTDTDCTLTGSIGMLSPNFNAYNVNLTTANCTSATINGDYAGLATLSDESGDGTLDTLTYIVNNENQYLTKIFTKTSNLSSIAGIWRGTFTNNEGKSTFYKGLISEDNEIKLLADTESFPFDQGSDIISGTAVVHTKDSIFSDNLKEIPANNNFNAILNITLEGVVVDETSMTGTFSKTNNDELVEFGSFSFEYDPIYIIPEQNFFVINDTKWDITKFNNNGVEFYSQALDLSDSFVLTSDRTTILETTAINLISGPTITVRSDLVVAPTDEFISQEPINILNTLEDTLERTQNIAVIGNRITKIEFSSNDLGDVIETTTVTEEITTTTTTISHFDSNNCRYLGNYDVVDPRLNIWNLYMVVSGCDTLAVRDRDGNDLGITYNLDGTYTGLATLEEQFSLPDHPHDHFKFMTFGMVDTTGTKTINNRLSLKIIHGNQIIAN